MTGRSPATGGQRRRRRRVRECAHVGLDEVEQLQAVAGRLVADIVDEAGEARTRGCRAVRAAPAGSTRSATGKFSAPLCAADRGRRDLRSSPRPVDPPHADRHQLLTTAVQLLTFRQTNQVIDVRLCLSVYHVADCRAGDTLADAGEPIRPSICASCSRAARAERYELHARHLNPQLTRMLHAIGFDRVYTRGERRLPLGRRGHRYLDMLAGFGVFALGRHHPVVRQALHDVLDAELADLTQFDAPPLAGALAEALLAHVPHLRARVLRQQRYRGGGGRAEVRAVTPPAGSASSIAITPSTD